MYYTILYYTALPCTKICTNTIPKSSLPFGIVAASNERAHQPAVAWHFPEPSQESCSFHSARYAIYIYTYILICV